MARYELNDGMSYHSIDAATTDAAEAAARRWIEGGDYLCPEHPRTTWVDCRITEVDADDEPVDDGESWTITRSLYRAAAGRVEADDLGEYAEIILDDHGEGCDHYRWVMAADRDEIVAWAESHGEATQ